MAYFARGHCGENAWNRLIAPPTAWDWAAVFITSLLNFNALLDAEKGSALTWVLPGLILVAAVLGMSFAAYLRPTCPAS